MDLQSRLNAGYYSEFIWSINEPFTIGIFSIWASYFFNIFLDKHDRVFFGFPLHIRFSPQIIPIPISRHPLEVRKSHRTGHPHPDIDAAFRGLTPKPSLINCTTLKSTELLMALVRNYSPGKEAPWKQVGKSCWQPWLCVFLIFYVSDWANAMWNVLIIPPAPLNLQVHVSRTSNTQLNGQFWQPRHVFFNRVCPTWSLQRRRKASGIYISVQKVTAWSSSCQN